jgi:serine/threonine protein kinase
VLFIAMRYVAGGDVGALLRRDGALSPGRAAAVISSVASALDAAHEAGLVQAVAFSPDGSTLAAGDASGRACLWSWTPRRGIARQLPLVLDARTGPWR